MPALDSMLWDLSLQAAREAIEEHYPEDVHLLDGGYLHQVAEVIEESAGKACRDAMADLPHLFCTPREWGLASPERAA